MGNDYCPWETVTHWAQLSMGSEKNPWFSHGKKIFSFCGGTIISHGVIKIHDYMGLEQLIFLTRENEPAWTE